MQQTMQAVEILLVEDNPGDIRLTQEALREAKIHSRLNVVMDGQAAMDYLHKENQYADATQPDMILLDLNLPKKTGYEVLEEIKNDDSLKLIPVVVLTSSQEDMDVVKTYSLHANCYITKPVELDQFIKIAQSIDIFWLSVVKLPTRKSTNARQKNMPN